MAGASRDTATAEHRQRPDRRGTEQGSGRHRLHPRLSGSTLFVNPLMAIYSTVDLMALAHRCLYLDRLEQTLTVRHIEAEIEQLHSSVDRRIPRIFPH